MWRKIKAAAEVADVIGQSKQGEKHYCLLL